MPEERRRLRWLHISDLHYNTSDTTSVALRDNLPVFLRKKNIRCDYLFCTGDIRTANKNPNDFTDDMAQYLINLCKATETPRKHLFIVPGNHDVNRDVPGRHEAIERVCLCGEKYYDSAKGEIMEEDLKAIHSGQAEFREFLRKIYPDERVRLYCNPLAPHFSIKTDDFNILHVDSTLSYTAGHEANDLILGTKLLQNALAGLDPEKPTVLLSHYPLRSLHQDEYKYVRELLYENGVNLWLAGHQHDQIVMPTDYFYSFQAGVLQDQKKTSATVLLGEFDPLTNTGHVVAYTWFPEGWGLYPKLRHDGWKEDRCFFHINLPGDKGLSPEAANAKRANQSFLDQLSVVDQLIPEIDHAEGQELEDILLDCWNTDRPHLILQADGGMGKTTMILKTCRELKIPSLYIPAEKLDSIWGGSIKRYCSLVLFGDDEKAFDEFTRTKYGKQSLILFIDGLNEVKPETERRLIREIKNMSLLGGIQFVVSSRVDFTTRYPIDGARKMKLLPLKDEQIRTVFSPEVWTNICNTTPLHHLLSNPMMVTMYKDISSIFEQHKDEECIPWIQPIQNATDLLQDYYMAQVAVMFSRDGMDGKKIMVACQAIFDILPAVAYEFEKTNSLNKKNPDFRGILEEVIRSHCVDEKALAPFRDRFRYHEDEIPALSPGAVTDLLTQETHLLYTDTDQHVTAFPHQIHRDFLSALWIVRQTEKDTDQYWNTRSLPISVIRHIQTLSGSYWDHGLANVVHEAGKNREDASKLTSNLLECFKYTDTSGRPDYSCLDLRELPIPNTDRIPEQKISLAGSRIDLMSIGKTPDQLQQYTHLRFSEQKDYLATFADEKIIVFSLKSDEKPFVFSVENDIQDMVFAGNYLFVKIDGYINSIGVFMLTAGRWTYAGSIVNSWSRYRSVFDTDFKSAVLKDNELHLYYNDCEVCYQLGGLHQKHLNKDPNAWRNPVDGIELHFSNSEQGVRKRKNDIVCQTEQDEMKAVSYQGGKLVVFAGDELLYVLAKGISLLKDASISGDGKGAVTLGGRTVDGKRTAQIWDLDTRKKIGFLLCPGSIERIHLSETRSLILGETNQATWIYDLETMHETWYQEHFISDQKGKMRTYGNSVLRLDDSGNLYLYDLKTGNKTELEAPDNNALLASFMPDGSVVTVGNKNKAVFRNIRRGYYSHVNSEHSNIIGINSFKNKPFIAVLTQNNKISIYHTGVDSRERILHVSGRPIVAVNSSSTLMACSGRKSFQTFHFEEKVVRGQLRGWWKENCAPNTELNKNADILDVSFNTENHELVVILSNGRILYCDEITCQYHSAMDVITNFNVEAYDFRGCICDGSLKSQLEQNGALIYDFSTLIGIGWRVSHFLRTIFEKLFARFFLVTVMKKSHP